MAHTRFVFTGAVTDEFSPLRAKTIKHSRSRLISLAVMLCGWALLRTQAGVQVQLGQNFTASTLFVDSSAVPPDSDGAVGPNHFVEFINGRFSVYNKSSGTKLQTMTDSAFWTNAGID